MSWRINKYVWVAVALSSAVFSSSCNMSPQAREAKYLKRGDALLAKKDYSRAILEFQNASKAMPKDAEPYYKMGLAYLAVRDFNGAASMFHKATQLNPKHVQAQLKLAEIMAATRDKKMVEDASNRLETILANAPDNAEASDTLAVAEWKLGQPEDAQKRLEDTLQKTPGHLQASMTLARMKLVQKDLAGAEEVLKRAVASAPDSPQAALALGQLYSISKQPEKAEAEIRRALQLDPKNASALAGLGAIEAAGHRTDEAEETYKRLSALPDKEYKHMHAVFLFQSGRRDLALAELLKLAQADPDDRAARSRLLAAYVTMGKMTEAQALLDAALKKNSKDTDALFQRAELSLRSGKADDAEKDLKQVIHFKPDLPQVHFALAQVYQAKGAREAQWQELNETLRLNRFMVAARVILARSFISANQAKSALLLLDQTPDEQKALLAIVVERNWALYATENIKEMREILGRALKVNRHPDLLIQDAVLKMHDKDYQGARIDADEMLVQNSQDVRAARLIAESYLAEKEPTKAMKRLSELAEGHPKSAPFQELFGEYLLSNGKLVEARKAFEAAKAADAGMMQADLALAVIDQREQHLDAARQHLTAVLAVDPKNVRALLLLGDVAQQAGDRDESIKQYRAVLNIDSSNIFALNNLAYTLALDKPDEALGYAQHAVELAPDSPNVEDTIGWVYYRKGIYDSAVNYLKMAVAKEPTPRREFHLGMSYIKAGNRELGQTTLRAALQKDPNLAKTEQGW